MSKELTEGLTPLQKRTNDKSEIVKALKEDKVVDTTATVAKEEVFTGDRPIDTTPTPPDRSKQENEYPTEPTDEEQLKKDFEDVENKLPTSILKNPELFENINNEFDKVIVGEHDTRRTLLLISLGGKLTENAEPTSGNLMINDESGAGKDYIGNEVLKILPKEDVIIRKRISEKVFTYWHNARFEPEFTWDGIVFYNEDITNSILNSDVFKVMSSSNGVNKSTILINQTPFEIVTNGKPVMIITIAQANPKPELLRRFPTCQLNTTEAQTKLILKRKAEFHKKGIRPSYDEHIKKALTKLKRVKIRVPFAPDLVNILNTKNIIIRTHFDRFIDYIKFSTAIYQKQRKKDKEGYLIATPQDYEIGRLALIKTTSNIFSVPLTKNQQKILEILKELPRTKIVDGTLGEKETKCRYSVTDLEPMVTFISDRTLRTELDKLTTFGFLEKDKDNRENATKPVMVYHFLELYKINIPKWKDIQNTSSASSASNDSSASSASNGGANEANEANER